MHAYHFPSDTQLLNEIDFLQSISELQSRVETEVQRLRSATEVMRTRLEEFNEGVREAFTIKKEAKGEEDQGSSHRSPAPHSTSNPDHAGPSRVSEVTPHSGGFRRLFFPWTSYDFSMPESDAVTQSNLIQIFSQHETAVCPISFLSSILPMRSNSRFASVLLVFFSSFVLQYY